MLVIYIGLEQLRRENINKRMYKLKQKGLSTCQHCLQLQVLNIVNILEQLSHEYIYKKHQTSLRYYVKI